MTSTLPPLVQAISGALGSAAANTLTYPLDLVVTRLQLQDPKQNTKRGGISGAIRVLRQIVRKHGWRAVYDGLWPDTCATLLSSFFYFYCYSFLRSLSTRRKLSLRGSTSPSGKLHKPSLLEELLLGFIAGVASRVISTPLNMVTLRLQAQNGEDSDNNSETTDSESDTPQKAVESVTDIVHDIYSKGGVIGFWRGFQTTTLLSLNPSITMAFLQMYRRLVSVLTSTSRNVLSARGLKSAIASKPNANQNLHPWEAFLGGAISNSIAIFLLYPLILAKTRVQTIDETSMTQVLIQAFNGTYRGSRVPRTEKQSGAERNTSIRGLYQGLDMKIVKGFLSQGVTFLVKGRIEQLIVTLYLMRLAQSKSRS